MLCVGPWWRWAASAPTVCLGSASLLIDFCLPKELEKEVDELERLHSGPGFSACFVTVGVCHFGSMMKSNLYP